VEQSAEQFLHLILPTLGRMREDAKVLGRYAKSDEHLAAAYGILDGLCQSVLMFREVSLPQLLGSADPIPRSAFKDRAWLSDVGYHVNDVLQNRGLTWPPPEDREPPRIVRDLQQMYEHLAFRHQYLAPVNQETLLAVVTPIGHKACELRESIDLPSSTPGRPNRRTRLVTRLGVSLTALATVIGIAQGPETFNQFPEEWPKFAHSVKKAATIAANEVVDLSLELGELLDRD
jgi:hypothetical protein